MIFLKILVVEDEINIQKIYEEDLKETDKCSAVFFASDGEQAYKYLNEHEFDLVF